MKGFYENIVMHKRVSSVQTVSKNKCTYSIKVCVRTAFILLIFTTSFNFVKAFENNPDSLLFKPNILNGAGLNYSQNDNFTTRFRAFAGYNYMNNSFLEFGIKRSRTLEFFKITFIDLGPYASVQVMLNQNPYTVPTVGYDFSFLIIDFKTSLSCPTDFKKYDLVITPEAGLSFFSAVTVTVGYCFPLHNNNFSEPTKLRLSLSLYFPMF